MALPRIARGDKSEKFSLQLILTAFMPSEGFSYKVREIVFTALIGELPEHDFQEQYGISDKMLRMEIQTHWEGLPYVRGHEEFKKVAREVATEESEPRTITITRQPASPKSPVPAESQPTMDPVSEVVLVILQKPC